MTILLLSSISCIIPSSVTAQGTGGTVSFDGDYHVIEVPDSVGGGFEPHILAAPGIDGTEWIYIDSPTGLGSGQSGNLYVSKDHGETWEYKTKGLNGGAPLGSGDSYTAVTADGTIYFTDLWLLTATVDTSNDGGNTWVRNGQASVTPIDDRQWFGLGPVIGGSPIHQPQALYLQYNQIPGGLYLMKSQVTKWGWGWRPCNAYRPIATVTGSRDNFVVDPRDGTIYMPNSEGNTLYMYVSTNGCQSFDRYQVMQSDKDFQSIFVIPDLDAAGNVYLGYSTEDNVSMARSTDKGQTWDVFNVTTTPGSRVLPWLTAGDAGRVALCYYETNATGMHPDEYDTNVSWSVWSAITIDALAAQPNFTFQMVLNYTHSGSIRTSGVSGNADRDLGDYMSDDMDQYGRHILTFGYDGNDGVGTYDAKVMYAVQRHGPFLKKGVGPVANFTYRTDGKTVYVDGSRSYDMSGEGLSNFEWTWGDDNNDTGLASLDHIYKKGGKYNITLKVTNKIDMQASYSVMVEIEVSGGMTIAPGLGIVALVIIVALIVTFVFRKKIKGLFGRKDGVTNK